MRHAELRITGRLKGLVAPEDIQTATVCADKYRNEDKVYVKVKTYPKPVHLEEEGYTGGNGTGINGDCLVAVVRLGNVVTFMLSWSHKLWYFKRDSRLGLVAA